MTPLKVRYLSLRALRLLTTDALCSLRRALVINVDARPVAVVVRYDEYVRLEAAAQANGRRARA